MVKRIVTHRSSGSPVVIAQRRRLQLTLFVASGIGVIHFGAQSAFTAAPVLEHTKGTSDSKAHQNDVDRTEKGNAKQHLSTNVNKAWNATLELQGSMGGDMKSPSATQGPPWTTCFVETITNGRNILEEWVMRGEPANVDAFRRWRGCTPDPISIRCEHSPPGKAQELTCIECVKHAGSSLLMNAAGPSTCDNMVNELHAEASMTFTNWDQCMAQTPGGASFCKSGNVAVVM